MKKLDHVTSHGTWLLIVCATILLTACNQHSPEAPLAQNTSTKGSVEEGAEPKRNINIWPSLNIAVQKEPEIERQVTEILSTMTLEQKIAQMVQPEIRDVTVEDMRRYGFGSYLNGGGAFPQNNKHATPQDWITLAENMYQASIDDSLDGSRIPTMWGTDAVHGHNNVIGATLFPHNIGLGAAHDPSLIEAIAEATAREVMATGIDWVFAPTVAVVRNDRWGRTYEGYSEDPEIVAQYSAAIVRGLQGAADEDFLGDRRVIATVKHFLGDGGTQDGVDQGNNTVDEQTLFDLHAQGYVGGLTAGAQTVMASFNRWQGKKIHGHKYLLTDVLKDKMGFDGLVVGDWLGHGQVAGCTNYSCSQSINAGLDIFMASGDSWKPLLENTIEQVKSGEIPLSRVDDAVTRILRVKLRAGLFDKPSPADRPLSGKLELIGASEHRALARRAVRESLVLLKNVDGLLPLNPQQRFLLAGDGADNIGKQSGGWTVTWQGTGNTNKDFPGGTSIYGGFKTAVEKAGGSVELAVDGVYQTKPDVAIVVFGEDPYAEGVGDIETIEYQPKGQTDLALLRKFKAQDIPVVAVFLSGRPLWVNRELNASDAFVAAWLPGSEGAGVSDVLLRDKSGNIAYDFTGKLSYSWPASVTQTELNRGDNEYRPLLPYGFGLQYGEDDALGNDLSEAVAMINPTGLDTRASITIFEKSLRPGLSASMFDQQTDSPITNNVASLGGLTVRTFDKDIQEDARLLTFTGDGSSGYRISANQPIGLDEIDPKSAALMLTVRVNQRPDEAVFLSVDCTEDCGGGVDLKPGLASFDVNRWQHLTISLNCLLDDLSKANTITAPFVLSTTGALELAFSEIKLVESDNAMSCR